MECADQSFLPTCGGQRLYMSACEILAYGHLHRVAIAPHAARPMKAQVSVARARWCWQKVRLTVCEKKFRYEQILYVGSSGIHVDMSRAKHLHIVGDARNRYPKARTPLERSP